MEIIRAEHSGFCFGVNRAIDMAFEEAASHTEGQLYSCGHLIHNSAVVNRLEEQGVKLIEKLSEAQSGDTVIVRSHGEPLEFYQEAEARGIRLIDTTCVFVEKIHKLVHEAHEKGQPVVVIGSRNHQEVMATNGWCGYDAVILENEEEAAEYLKKGIKGKPLIVCQTTA